MIEGGLRTTARRSRALRGLCGLALAAAAVVAGCSPPVPDEPPNILFLVIDCLRADRYAAADSYSRPLTPNLDTLLAHGVAFTNAFAQASWTRPSVPSLLTGLYPSEHGLAGFEQDGDSVRAASLPPEAVTLAERLKEAGYATALVGEQNQLAPRFGLDQGFDYYNHRGAKASRIQNRFLGWLDQEGQRPFFAYLHYLELHWPYCPPELTEGRFTPDYAGRSFCYQWRKLRSDLRSGAVVLSEDEIEAMAARYDEELLALDAHIGRLFEQLKARGLWDNTLIVVTADHGEEFFEHGGMGHGASLHDELIRVPLVFKPPAAWRVDALEVDTLVELRSIAPTLVEAAGGTATAATRAAPSLFSALRGKTLEDPDFVIAEGAETIAARDRDFKLIVSRDGHEAKLFDLAADPGELVDISATRPQTVSKMARYVDQWQRSLSPLTVSSEELGQETVEGLRALGYLD